MSNESPICDALWAASELIEDSKRAVQELYEQAQDQQSSRAADLHLEIESKLAQAKGICGLICQVGGNEPLAESASAAEDLIEGVEKALGELQDIERGRNSKEVQS